MRFLLMLYAVLALLLSPFSALAQAPPEWRIPPDEQPSRSFTAAELAGEQVPWGVARLKATLAHAKGIDGRGIKVAVVDTAGTTDHPDLQERFIAGKSFTGEPQADGNGHGTHCAGTVLASVDGNGVVGVAPKAGLLLAKVLSNGGSGSVTAIANGIDWSVAQGADVISMSLGGPAPDQWTKAAVERALAAGVIVIAAAGNEGPGQGTTGWPAGYAGVVAVAATDSGDRVATFSSRGQIVLVAAPGVDIKSTWPGGRYSAISGTSMACPHVAGLAALWCQANPTVAKVDRPVKFRAAVTASALDLPPTGRDTSSGFGIPDGEKLTAGAVVPGPIVPTPEVIEFGPGDLTPEGMRKLKLLNPRLEGIAFKLAPVPTPMPAPLVPVPAMPEKSGTRQEWYDVPGYGRRLITLTGPAAPTAGAIYRATRPACPTCR